MLEFWTARTNKAPRHRNVCAIASIVTAMALLAFVARGHADEYLPPPEGEVVLTIAGDISHANVEGEARFDLTMIEKLPAHGFATTTSVTDGVNRFEGVLMRDILERAGAEGETVTAIALNDYLVDIPMSDFYDYGVLAALKMDGERLLRRDKGPIWIVYPRDDFDELDDIRFDYRWVWQLTRLEVR